MKRIYIAGPYSSNNVLGVLQNIGRGIRAGTNVFLRGDAPFTPWLDYHFVMARESAHLSVEAYYRYSEKWLEVSDELYVLYGWKESTGTKREIKRARELGIPIFLYDETADEAVPFHEEEPQ